ncbi:hypothetical protein FJT64_016021 [Amphibalanus amphitrite]|uniref:Uncharacterized protein n=1 Tax=Amphibalanus amphitrite TaxID=1232801 RepID=A0A6A4X7I2_AMPAM|nr:hypothetical protein FJT64_016021 [Amphibalanus amphitrite]
MISRFFPFPFHLYVSVLAANTFCSFLYTVDNIRVGTSHVGFKAQRLSFCHKSRDLPDCFPVTECGEGSEPRDPLAALASQIQYAFIDPQGNVYFNVMDESGIIHLPPVAGYYMAPSYPGGPDLASGDGSSAAGSRPRSELSDDATSATGSRPISPSVPDRHNSSGPEHDYAEQEQQASPGDEGKTRRLKKKKKKQKKKTHSVDSGVTDDGSDGCREPPPTPDCVAICSDSSASGDRVRSDHKTSGRPASDQTSSGVQSDVSLPDSPQRRPSGDRSHVTDPAASDTVSRDGQLLHSAATALSRQLDTQLKMQPTAVVTEQAAEQPPSSQPESQPKNEPAAVSALEAAILSPAQPAAEAALPCGDPDAAPDSGRDATDAVVDDDDSEGGSPEREPVDDDSESCDSFVYEDKSLGEPAASPPPGDFLDTAATPVDSDTLCDTSRKSSSTSQASEVIAEFEDEPVPVRTFTDLSVPVDLRRTVILEETESERDRESSPGSVSSQETGRLSEKEVSEEHRSISSAVRGWLKDQSPEAVFVVADNSDDSDVDDDDWESDAEAEASAPTTTSAAPPKNVQGNPSPASRSSVLAGERVANRTKASAARLNPAAYYSLGVALDESPSPPAVLQLVDLDERAVLTVPLDGSAPAGVPSAGGDSDGSEEVDPVALGAPAPADTPRASLAQELLQVGSLHRASDRQLIGDSALYSAAAAPAAAPASKALVCPEARAEAEEADEGYGGSPLASPEARPRPRGLPPHPLHHLGAETPAPWGVCCSLQ